MYTILYIILMYWFIWLFFNIVKCKKLAREKLTKSKRSQKASYNRDKYINL